MGGEMAAGCVVQLAPTLSVPVCPYILLLCWSLDLSLLWLTVSLTGCKRDRQATEPGTQQDKLLFWLWVRDNEATVWGSTCCYTDWAAIVSQHRGTVRSTVGSVLGRDGTGVLWGWGGGEDWQWTKGERRMNVFRNHLMSTQPYFIFFKKIRIKTNKFNWIKFFENYSQYLCLY